MPAEARLRGTGPAIVIDQIRASTSLTTLLDLGAREVLVAGGLAAARRLARERGSLLMGERHARKPRGFDFDNSPSELTAAAIRGRSVVLSTTNGTAVLRRLHRVEHVLIGCTRNARACADAALGLAEACGEGVQVVCAGQQGGFVLDDAVAAGVIVGRLDEAARARGSRPVLTDGAAAAVRLRDSFPDLMAAMEASDGGRVLRAIGQQADTAFCAQEDATATVPVRRAGAPMRIVRHRS